MRPPNTEDTPATEGIRDDDPPWSHEQQAGDAAAPYTPPLPPLPQPPPLPAVADLAQTTPAAPLPTTLATMPFDPYLAAALTVLLALGLTLVYSSSAVYAARNLGDAHRFLRAQAVWTSFGLGAMAIGMGLPGHLLARRALWLLGATLLLLTLVLVPGIGHFVGGARRWLVLGPISCQPSEAAKLTCTVVLAHVFSRRGDEPLTARALLVPVGICQLPIALILLEPDLGTAIVIELILGIMLFAAGLRLRVLLMLALAAMPVLYHLIVGTPFRLRRMLGYIDPWAFRSTIGYQVTEALISIGSGGLFGKGLGDGMQKLFFLPEAHTDFIFAILAEELGLAGVMVVLVCFGTVVVRGIRLSIAAQAPFDRYLALGLTSLVAVPAILNLCVATGLLPTKGLPLPFISYGGSNLLVTLMGMGLLFRIDHTVRQTARSVP